MTFYAESVHDLAGQLETARKVLVCSGGCQEAPAPVVDEKQMPLPLPPIAEYEPEEVSHINISDLKDKAPAKKRGRPVKETKAEEVPVAPPVPAEKALTLEEDIIPAFQKFAREKSREEAGKIIAAYGAKSVRELPADKYAEILGKLQ